MPKFSQEGAIVPYDCVWHVEMMMSHHVHKTTDRTTNLLISSNVHFVHLGGGNKQRKWQTNQS